ncbi:penicillin-binding protein 1C [Curvibacter sp. HBC28]|uniref:peptidoglycan glycosyltransferase n=1 Tax=Curvibacter microcysteis TaxID=3026419 RepID=A0ABT5MG92_9BURK|nr:penicillin-binding protein 1C [Curvibacter sp. HBC28]MDD0815606.1 penicillin-binding protein 1C [Curvibacter sp. HBC28]
MKRLTRRWPAARRLRALLLALGLLGAAVAAQALPSYDEVRRAHRPSDTQVLDRHGELLHTVRTDPSARRGDWLTLDQVSPALRLALLLSEDRRFYEHSGVDWQAVSAAAWGNLWNSRTRGASTLTMQLAGLLDGDWRAGPGGRSVVQKLGQTVAAQVLERHWRKDQILEAYLNLVPFRGELVGLDALSRSLFGKAAHGLDEREAAVAVALLRAPNARLPVLVRRACGVLTELQRLGDPGRAAPDCQALDLWVGAALQRPALEPSRGLAPHFARLALRQQSQGGRALVALKTPLSAPVQRFAVQSLQRQLRELAGRQVEDGAVLVLDNASGEVLAWVGSSGDLSRASEVDAVLAPRQPGSTLKPFLYAQALAEKRLTAASLIDDSAAQLPTASGLYIPQNYDHRFKGWVSVRTALAASLNVPAVRTLTQVTPDAFHRQLLRLGLPLRESGDYFGYSLALGSAEVPLLRLTNAYRVLANGGRFSEPVWQLPGPGTPARAPGPVVLDPRAAWLVGDMLSDAQARGRTFGSDSVLATRFWSAVKTGTSKDMRDNWALGWSARYTVGVWVGNARGQAMREVSGTSGAAPVWAEVMGFLHAHEPSRAPAPPPGLVSTEVRFALPERAQAAGQWPEAPRREWFLQGTEQTRFAVTEPAAQVEGRLSARIAEPAEGTVLALDPDIPPQHQRVLFRASSWPAGSARGSAAARASAGLQWRLDGRAVARGGEWRWLPWPGRHRVQLSDARGQLLHEITLEVRGAGVRAGVDPPGGPTQAPAAALR